jgi:hypothetical protein
MLDGGVLRGLADASGGDAGWLEREPGTECVGIAVSLVDTDRGWEFGIVAHYRTADGRGWGLHSPRYKVWPDEIGPGDGPEEALEALGHAVVDVAKAWAATIH